MNSASKEAKLQTEDVHNKLDLAKRYLRDSQIALQNGGVRLATDGAYNAAELAMKAKLEIHDRVITATALITNSTLITKDPEIRKIKNVKTIW